MRTHVDPRTWLGRHVAGRYRVLRELSRGGMGVVFQAVQEGLERDVALKIMLPGPAADDASRRRFIHEAQALSRIPHPNIVTIFDFGEAGDGSLFIAMELVAGRNLREHLHDAVRMSWIDTVPVVVGIARALAVAHASGILHRDLKPENVMLVQDRCTVVDVKLLDFGLARALGGSDNLTQVNAIPGTPNYIAPERVVSRVEDPRSDLYALGAIWFELLTGRPLFVGETMAAILLAQVQQPVPALSTVAPDAEVPPELEAVIARLLAKAPDDRWPDVAAFLEELGVVAEQLLGAGFATTASPTVSSPSIPAPRVLPQRPTPMVPPSRWTTGTPQPQVLTPRATPMLATPPTTTPAIADADGALPVLPGKTALFAIGQDQLTVQSEWLSARSVIECAAFFRGRVLRRDETPLPRETSLPQARERLDEVHQAFVDLVHAKLKRPAATDTMQDPPGTPVLVTEPADVSAQFFEAAALYLAGNIHQAMALLEQLDVPGADERIRHSRDKLAMLLAEPLPRPM